MDAEQFRSSYQQGQRDFRGVDLSGVDLSSGSFPGVKLRDAVLRGAVLRDCNLSGADLGGTDLRDAQLQNAILGHASFREAKMRSAILTGATLNRADMFAAVLVRGQLQRARLTGVCMVEADLRAADMTDADLEDADLSGAVLRSATLSGVVFTGADLSAANLRYAIGNPRSRLNCRITSGTCELSGWNQSTIVEWGFRGAEVIQWNLQTDKSYSPIDESQRIDALNDLLRRMFNSDELRLFIGIKHPEIKAQVPSSGATFKVIVYEFVDLLEKKGMIDDKFFALLQKESPRRRLEIESVAKLWLSPVA